MDEWMLYTFVAYDLEGTPFETTTEGGTRLVSN